MKRVLLFFLIFIFSINIKAQEAFYIKNFDVDIIVNDDGSFDVTEKIHVFFNVSRRGIIRQIPYKYDVQEIKDTLKTERTNNTKTHEILFENIEVDSFQYKSYTEGYFQYIRIGSEDIFLTGDKEYTIRYKVWGALNRFKNHDEFYWNVTGNGWDCKIENASYNISYVKPASIKDDNVRVYTGKFGDTSTNATKIIGENNITGVLTQSLKAYEGLTVAVKFPKKYFKNIEVPISKYANAFYFKNHHANYQVLYLKCHCFYLSQPRLYPELLFV